MDIFEALRVDHDRQRDLIGQVLETVGDSPERAEMFDELASALEAHAAAEERYFYTVLMEHDLTQEKARHSVHEHAQLDDLVEKLQAYDRTAPAWLETARELEHKLTHHLDEEEREVFQLAGKALTEAQKASLAEEYREMMRERLSA
ncbi:MAG: hemerythrin domain-containing protein [Acidimicrobiales bacterium]|nr:hemerythrin domain-containing protein [Acidimicrobiales bacterium]